ncbi:MAG: hypothetical protein KKA07_13145 [Bacteroidetes bacterium]|nr:hypothetical protein [Bacteroidota bacterium]MBU1720005.1 hypothetical protein [Bacteroidota bacterium]
MRKFRIVSLILFSLLACKKDNDRIPEVAVDITIYISQPSFTNLQAINGWVYITGGVRGIILYRASQEEIFAFERDCPYRPFDDCARIEVEESGLIAVDSCCMSRFLLTDGTPIEGPASLPMKQYHTTFDGSVLYIYN